MVKGKNKARPRGGGLDKYRDRALERQQGRYRAAVDAMYASGAISDFEQNYLVMLDNIITATKDGSRAKSLADALDTGGGEFLEGADSGALVLYEAGSYRDLYGLLCGTFAEFIGPSLAYMSIVSEDALLPGSTIVAGGLPDRGFLQRRLESEILPALGNVDRPAPCKVVYLDGQRYMETGGNLMILGADNELTSFDPNVLARHGKAIRVLALMFEKDDFRSILVTIEDIARAVAANMAGQAN